MLICKTVRASYKGAANLLSLTRRILTLNWILEHKESLFSCKGRLRGLGKYKRCNF